MVDGATSLGVTALINIILSLVSIAFSWWALTNLRLDVFMRQPTSVHAKALMILLSVVLGHGLASFLIDYMGWSRLISQLF
ncbi:DUF1146 domain-containing protein [Polycladomyces sp. WAk]|uniref:DUF1146 domain-containing protein n=1 Tax=Polycladomyces zharkentensis TaxID=2807616 RepID=A0ABS2WER8_9BACL|nr:DUF1146 family protein [Polycladomyces sp. WAk]MBN2908035.1 DUF1146 domain-containing protein [Polycladomyces sp. WAk]